MTNQIEPPDVSDLVHFLEGTWVGASRLAMTETDPESSLAQTSIWKALRLPWRDGSSPAMWQFDFRPNKAWDRHGSPDDRGVLACEARPSKSCSAGRALP